MKKTLFLSVGALCALGAAAIFSTNAAEEKPKLTIKKVMQIAHKAPEGTDPLCKRAAEGKATQEELAKLVEFYTAMMSDTPPRGDAASWKAKSTALLKATVALQKGEEGALPAFKAAVDCKGCHAPHKPQPPAKNKK
ncbi:MAG: hypothetical protein EXS28_03940 [Pedosphaera sp.]|nr:hypothetical protein [Pedosphaera sp.]